MNALDWPGLLRVGLGVLRLQPAQFWALTPAELMLMLGLGQGAAPMDRARFEALARRHPDTTTDKD